MLSRDHVTSLLRDRHWLPVKQRVEYKLCTMVHRCLYGDAPAYLVDLIVTSAAATGRAGLRSAASGAVAVQRTTSVLARGINAHHHFVMFILLQLSNVNSRLFYSITLLTYIVRRHSCASAPTSP